MTIKNYRPDIDGLRAVAVLGVILFHAGLPLHGGFVGVDVFFVISGYLITKIILRETKEKTFSLSNFWIRRIRRILPAATVVTLTTLCAGYLILEPTSFSALGKSAIAQSAMLANVFFWRSSGYFSESSDLQPLLHTWSLSVEEQFYVVFPILLAFFLRRNRETLLVLALASLVSFSISAWGVFSHPSATFYLLPTRAWELAAGALLAIMEPKFRIRGVSKELAAASGLGAILISMVFFSEETSFPGTAALLPVGGTVLLIAANCDAPTLIGRALSIKPAVAIGLASYSLYLWHWPVFVFCRHILVEQSLISMIVGMALTGILSYFSWRFVEIPFRSSSRLRSPRIAFSFGALASSMVVAAGLLIWFTKGLPSRIDPDLRTIQEDIVWAGREYTSDSAVGVQIGVDRETVMRPPDFVLWGDSHGMAAAQLIDDIAKEQNLTGIAHLSSGHPPVTGLWMPTRGVEEKEKATLLNQRRLDSIIQSGTKHVILISRWNVWIKGRLPSEIDEKNGVFKEDTLVVDSASGNLTPEGSRSALERQLSIMLKRLGDHGINIWFLIQVPSSSRPEVARDFYTFRRFSIINGSDFRWDTLRSDYERERVEMDQLLERLDVKKLTLLDPVDHFYRDGERLLLFSDRAYYRDEDHLTRPGAEHYLRTVVKSAFTAMRSATTSTGLLGAERKSIKSHQNPSANKTVDSTR